MTKPRQMLLTLKQRANPPRIEIVTLGRIQRIRKIRGNNLPRGRTDSDYWGLNIRPHPKPSCGPHVWQTSHNSISPHQLPSAPLGGLIGGIGVRGWPNEVPVSVSVCGIANTNGFRSILDESLLQHRNIYMSLVVIKPPKMMLCLSTITNNRVRRMASSIDKYSAVFQRSTSAAKLVLDQCRSIAFIHMVWRSRKEDTVAESLKLDRLRLSSATTDV